MKWCVRPWLFWTLGIANPAFQHDDADSIVGCCLIRLKALCAGLCFGLGRSLSDSFDSLLVMGRQLSYFIVGFCALSAESLGYSSRAQYSRPLRRLAVGGVVICSSGKV